MTFDGPAAGHELLQTEADPTGMSSLGTMNNCGSGRTPWGTYLTCEENFNGYFGSTRSLRIAPRPTPGRLPALRHRHRRLGLRLPQVGQPLGRLRQNPNEPHRAGYIVEIDPADPTSTPVKHTALGRFKHENAAYAIADDGRFVVYMGDDERGEYMYKWVSASPTWKAATLPADGRRHAVRGRVRR
jgi:secreted PhoX family phosphatase